MMEGVEWSADCGRAWREVGVELTGVWSESSLSWGSRTLREDAGGRGGAARAHNSA